MCRLLAGLASVLEDDFEDDVFDFKRPRLEDKTKVRHHCTVYMLAFSFLFLSSVLF